MLTADELVSLASKPESSCLDFKREQYDLSKPQIGGSKGRLALVKDILCMANTPRDDNAYILTGVAEDAGKPNTITGIKQSVDDSRIQDLLSAWIEPIPSVEYYERHLDDKIIGVYEIHPVQSRGPFYVREDLNESKRKVCGEFLNRDLLHFRRGTKNDHAQPSDKLFIVDWFSSAQEARWQDWGEFKESCYHFDKRRHFILISSSLSHIDQSTLRPFANIGWSAVIDFDLDSDETGLLKAVTDAEYQRNIIRSVKGEYSSFSSPRETYWFFARGMSARDRTRSRTDDWRTWRAFYGSEINRQLEHIASMLPPAPVTFVVMWNDDERARYLRYTLGSTGVIEGANYVVVSDSAEALQAKVDDDYEAVFLQLPIAHLSSGIQVEFSSQSADRVEYTLPSDSGTPILLPSAKISWLQSQLDVVHLGLGASTAASDDENEGESDFLTGGTVTWRELDLGKDAARNLTTKITRVLRQDLRNGNTSRVEICHIPGAGGTTIAKRALWDLHEDYPSVVVRTGDARGIFERIEFIGAQTRQPVLALVDSADISEREIADLQKLLQARHKRCVLLSVSRRNSLPRQTRRTFALESQLRQSELPRFIDKFIAAMPARTADIRQLGSNDQQQSQTAFFFGLTAYGKNYKGLESYIDNRLASLSPVQLRILAFLSIAYKYGQRGIAPQVFQNLLGLSNGGVSIPSVFANNDSVLDILTEEGIHTEWRPIHHVIADEMLRQILANGATARNTWRYSLSTWAKAFIDFCATHQHVVSERILDLLRRVFIYRDAYDALGKELNEDSVRNTSRLSSFSLIIQDIPSPEGRMEVLKLLAETIPGEAHFWAHLGRYQSAMMENYEAALESVDRAINLQQDDPLLWHMKGMSYRYHAQKLMSSSEVSLGEIVDLAERASACFEESRNINPDHEHAYISEIQLLARVLNFAVKDTDESIFQYTQRQKAIPYLREAFDRAESLLAIVRANREGTRGSSYEERCRARISEFYGDYLEALQIWDSLLDRHDVDHPPVRRQIVYAHIARSQSWGQMPNKSRDRCIALLQDNLDEQPYNAKDLRLWLQAVRLASPAPTIESLIERVSYWKANTSALDATYYLYVLYWLQAIEGLTYERDLAERFMQESAQQSQNRRNRLRSFEWLGNGRGINRLVHQSTLGNWNRDINFWSNANTLSRVEGVVTEVRGPERGTLQINGMSCFFIPGAKRDDPISKDSVNRRVDFYIGFSYSGVRAWDVKLL